MQVKIVKDYQEASNLAALAIIDQVKQKPDSVICLAAGDTPKLAYQKMVELAKIQEINFSDIHFIGLDEWVGISPDIAGSCANFLYKAIFIPLGIPEDHIHLFDVMAKDLERECKKMDHNIFEKGGIDLMMVGIGMNGHIGFNEPGTLPNLKSHVIVLDETTQSVGQKYFEASKTLKKGITLGFQHLLNAGKVILMASGINKAEIIKKALNKEISIAVPASIIRNHDNSLVLLDEAAASSLSINENNL